MRMNRAELARFKTKIHIDGNCWLWTGAKTKGYGRFGFRGKTHYAHRLAYEHKYGPIPENMSVDHLVEEGICKSSLCVRPSHLQLLTVTENSFKRHRSSISHFACGHPKIDNITNEGCCGVCRKNYISNYRKFRRRINKPVD